MNSSVIEFLDSHLSDPDALTFILNTYLIAVGYRPLYLLDKPDFSKYIPEVSKIFPELTFGKDYFCSRFWVSGVEKRKSVYL